MTKNSVRRPETDSISECALILVDGPIRGRIRFGLTNDGSMFQSPMMWDRVLSLN